MAIWLSAIPIFFLRVVDVSLYTVRLMMVVRGRKVLAWGPQYVVVKKGEHGCLLFAKDLFFSAPAYPLEDIHDPTGAGDTFACAFIGHLARNGAVTHDALRKAVIFGSVMASYCVESFSLGQLQTLTVADITQRYEVKAARGREDAPAARRLRG